MLRNRFIVLVGIISILLAAFVAMVPSVHAAGSLPAVTYHTHVPGVAALQVNTCPDFGDWFPETDTFCEEWDIHYYLEGDHNVDQSCFKNNIDCSA